MKFRRKKANQFFYKLNNLPVDKQKRLSVKRDDQNICKITKNKPEESK